MTKRETDASVTGTWNDKNRYITRYSVYCFQVINKNNWLKRSLAVSWLNVKSKTQNRTKIFTSQKTVYQELTKWVRPFIHMPKNGSASELVDKKVK